MPTQHAVEAPRIEDVRDLLGLLDVVTVVEEKLSARRGDFAEEAGLFTNFNVDVSDGVLKTIFGLKFADAECRITSRHVVEWRCDRRIVVGGRCMAEFLERVAFMTAYPYLRESIAASATRLRVPVPTLGLVKQGEVDLSIDIDDLDEFTSAHEIGHEPGADGPPAQPDDD